MSRRKVNFDAEYHTEVVLQSEIIDKFGKEAIDKARTRLCMKCKRHHCSLLPLCSDGKECPYFELDKDRE